MDTWHKLVIEGPRPAVRAFVTGFAAGRQATDAVLLGDDLDVEPQSLAERIRDIFDSASHHLVFAHPPTADLLVAALADVGPEVDLRLHSRYAVTGGRFEVKVEAFNPDVATRIRQALFESLPAGTSVAALDDAEERHPESRGAELYAPAHSYTYRATATLTGPLLPTLEMYRRARDLDFVKVGRLSIDARELPSEE